MVKENKPAKKEAVRPGAAPGRRRQAGAAPIEREDQFRLIFEKSRDMIFTINIRGEFISLSPAVKEFIGYDPAELQGRHFRSIVHPDDVASCEEAIRKNIEKGEKTPGFEYRVKDKAGNWHWHITSGSPVFDDKGSFLHFLGIAKDITVQKQAVEDLLKEEQRFRNLASLLPQTVFETDERGNFTFVNQHGYEMFGYSEADVAAGLNIIEMIVQEDRGRAAENIGRRIKGGDLPPQEYTALRKDGSRFPVVVYASIVMVDSRYAGVRGVLADITERKRVEHELKEINERLMLAHEASNSGAWDWDMATGNLSWSKEMYGILGLDPEAVTASFDTWRSVLHPEDRQTAEDKINEAIRDHKKLYNEYRIILPSGEVRWVTARGDTRYDLQGKAQRMVGICIDTTERRRAEEMLRGSQQKFQALVETTNDFIWEMDLDGAYTYCSPQMEKLWGFKPQEMVGKTPFEFLPPEEKEQLTGLFITFLRSASNFTNMEIRSYDSSGQVKFLEISGVPFTDKEGRLSGYRGITRDVTGRKQSEESLRESEERYRSLVESALEAIIVVQDGLVKYANPRTIELMGYPTEEFSPQPFIDFIHPEDRAKVIGRHLKSLKGEEFEMVYPVRLVDKLGSIRWVQISTAMINWQGRPATLTFLADISENKKAERATEIQRDLGIRLSQADSMSEALPACLEAAIEISGMDCGGIYLVDPGTGDLRLAHSAGLSPEFTGNAAVFTRESAKTHMIMEGRPNYTQYAKLGLSTDSIWQSEGLKAIAFIPVSSGKLIIACLNIASHSVEDVPRGSRSALEAIASQVGGAIDRLQVRENLAASEEKYRHLVENASDVIWNMTPDLVFTYVSPSVFQQTGFTVGEVTGRPLWDFLTPTGKSQILAVAKKKAMAGEGVRWETASYSLEQLCKDGSLTWTEVISSPIYDSRGQHTGFRGITRDITNRKRLEEERQRVQKLESVGLLAGGIAHDFNNILTSILGNVSMARMEADPESEIYKSLEQAEKASQRAKDLTRQLLTFSKGGAPVTRLASLTELIRETAGFALRGSNVKCSFNIPGDLWHAEIDTGQVSQVIQNLVINSQQAMPAGGTIEIAAGNMVLSSTQSLGGGLPLQDGNYIRIAVIDHGIGIASEHLDKVFDPFFTTKQKGSGLGLATSFSIARQHGGHLSVESEPGKGSTFYLYLPASREIVAPKQAGRETIKAEGRARILIMDDEQGIRDLAGRMLNNLGYKDVEFAADGAEAVTLYKASLEKGDPYSAVILDLTIPGGMGGKETVRELIRIDPGVRAVVSSGYADQSVMAEYTEYGFRGMVAKPYTLAELGKAVRDIIG